MHSIAIKKESLLYKDIPDGESLYFCTSYYFPVSDITTAIADNNMKFSASVESGNFYGIQFSPEKSGEAGKKIIRNFIELSVV
jgi:imidazole glycerol-phosphate synthase subunit HisH